MECSGPLHLRPAGKPGARAGLQLGRLGSSTAAWQIGACLRECCPAAVRLPSTVLVCNCPNFCCADRQHPLFAPLWLQVAIAWMHLSRQVHTGYLSIACALQCILLLFRQVTL